MRLALSDGSRIRADHVVLALGNPASSGAPAAPNCGERWHASPWLGDALRVRFEGERILILGAGLTAVDCALALHSQELSCRTFMVSRRGILPHVHNLRLPPAPPPSFEHRGNLGRMFAGTCCVMENLFGDVISDLCAGLVGGLGLVPGANIGAARTRSSRRCTGRPPTWPGKGVANPIAVRSVGGADARSHRPP